MRAITGMTNLSQIKHTNQACGPVNNVLYSALTSGFLESNYRSPGEKIIYKWEQLVQRIQGKATSVSILTLTDTMFSVHRCYNSRYKIYFVNENLSVTVIGTCKKSLDYPSVFGTGPIWKNIKAFLSVRSAVKLCIVRLEIYQVIVGRKWSH